MRFIFDINESNYSTYLKFFVKYNREINDENNENVIILSIDRYASIVSFADEYYISLEDFIKYFNNY